MICAECKHVLKCQTVTTAMDIGANITDCKKFVPFIDEFAYKRIAYNEDLMHLIYDYFIENVDERVLEDNGGYDGVKDFIAKYLRHI